jgi:hypothetical protein
MVVKKRRRIARRWIVLLAALTVVGGLVVGESLVSASLNRPSFRPPVEWGALSGDGAQRDGTNVPTTVRLFADGRAQLKNFPQGTEGVERDEYNASYNCLRVSTSTRYTGKATWTAPSAGEFSLRFGRSSVDVSSDVDGYFLGTTPDWDYVWILECVSGDVEWNLGYSCGDDGGGDSGRLDIPCRKD